MMRKPFSNPAIQSHLSNSEREVMSVMDVIEDMRDYRADCTIIAHKLGASIYFLARSSYDAA